jgi:hypothetical protein
MEWWNDGILGTASIIVPPSQNASLFQQSNFYSTIPTFQFSISKENSNETHDETQND